MSVQHQFYVNRAAEARAAADAATLDNVRDRWLRSEATWTEMAARTADSEKSRANLIAEKEAERAALSVTAQAEREEPQQTRD
jgi:hypothetical protein